jgi:hypothetical protein
MMESESNLIQQPESCQAEALQRTSTEKKADYGDSYFNHQRIATLWNAYITNHNSPEGRQEVLTAADVACMMILFKMARSQGPSGFKRDTLVDMFGYLYCLENMVM